MADWQTLSDRINHVAPSATLAVDSKAKAMKAAGIDVIGFGAGEPNFPTPAPIVAAAAAAVQDPKNYRYTPTAGLPELRQAIADKTLRDSGYEVDPSQVIVTNGGKQAVYESFQILLNEGDEVIIPTPYWTSYPEAVKLAGGVPVTVFAGADRNFEPSIEAIEAARTEHTKAIIVNTPNNPTGAVWKPETVKAIAQWAIEHHVWVISDEIYEHLNYDGAKTTYIGAAVPEVRSQLLVLNGVAKTYAKLYRRNLSKALELLADLENSCDLADDVCKRVKEESGLVPKLANDNGYQEAEAKLLKEGYQLDDAIIKRAQEFTLRRTVKETDRATYQAMEALVHNLNTMHSRAGAQIPFSSINYGMDTSPEGRMAVKNVLLATEAGLGNGETPVFPIHIFRVKEGVSYNPGDPNYDLFKLACRVSAKRLFPNFSFMDAPFNAQYYVEGDYDTEIAYMGCRTRVMGNVYDPSRQTTGGRGNLSFTSINLPRLAIKAHGNIDLFFEDLDRKIDLVINQLLERLEIQSKKKVRNYPFLMGQGIWIDSGELGPDDEVREVLKHGTLSVGFIGLAETLKSLVGAHHGESVEARNLGLEIVAHMRNRMDQAAAETGLNFSLLATPAEGLSGRFVRMDKERYGVIEGVTDRAYYTNSFHVPVYYPISAFDKIKIEAPYHEMTNAGHISYIEMDGDPTENLDAFEAVIRCMKENNIGYGSVNHPVDHDPVCGYTGIINDECPKCGRHEGDGNPDFERIRRITGYLVGTLDHFNDAKYAEVMDRVKHSIGTGAGEFEQI